MVSGFEEIIIWFKKKVTVVVIGWLLMLSASVQTKDTIFFKDGQLLIGDLMRISLGRIEFDADNFDVLSIKGNQIKRIVQLIYKLETIHHDIFIPNYFQPNPI